MKRGIWIIIWTAMKAKDINIQNKKARFNYEAHRFAIEYHRSLRSKGQVHSILDDIPGIGPARRKALMKHFMGADNIRQADVEELKQIPSMNEKAARAVFEFFHEGENME